MCFPSDTFAQSISWRGEEVRNCRGGSLSVDIIEPALYSDNLSSLRPPLESVNHYYDKGFSALRVASDECDN